MLFTTKFTSALVAIAAAAFPVRSAVVAHVRIDDDPIFT